jgi:DNA polymerase III subunit beta
MIARTIFAISSEESRYTLNGGLMVLKPESITMVATDGHRLAHIEKQGEKFDVSGENRTLVPKKAMSEIYSLLQNSDVDSIEFAKDESTLFFRIGERLLTSRQLTGQFPNYEAVLDELRTAAYSFRHVPVRREICLVDSSNLCFGATWWT